MLIFTRHVQQVVTIGDDIEVKVLGIKGNQVRLGITAPKQIPVHREEVYDRIKQGTEAVKMSRGGLWPQPRQLERVWRMMQKIRSNSQKTPLRHFTFLRLRGR